MISRHLHEDSLLAWLQTLVRHPSGQSELQEKDPQVLSFIKTCAAPLLRDLGAQFRYDPMGNLIAEIGPQDTGRSLLFVAYAMTHPAANMSEPFAATLIDTPRGRAVRGRGVAEQKTALAAALGAYGAALGRGNLGGRLILALTATPFSSRVKDMGSGIFTRSPQPRMS